jgi:hypothetical protein
VVWSTDGVQGGVMIVNLVHVWVHGHTGIDDGYFGEIYDFDTECPDDSWHLVINNETNEREEVHLGDMVLCVET